MGSTGTMLAMCRAERALPIAEILWPLEGSDAVFNTLLVLAEGLWNWCGAVTFDSYSATWVFPFDDDD